MSILNLFSDLDKMKIVRIFEIKLIILIKYVIKGRCSTLKIKLVILFKFFAYDSYQSFRSKNIEFKNLT